MHPTFRRLGPSELLPRYIFAESLVARRRVLEVDAVASTGGESARFLLERGARVVVACDADLSAVQAAQKAHGGPALRFRANVYEDLEPGSFDLVLVADLAPYVRAPALLAELARLVAIPSVAAKGEAMEPCAELTAAARAFRPVSARRTLVDGLRERVGR